MNSTFLSGKKTSNSISRWTNDLSKHSQKKNYNWPKKYIKNGQKIHKKVLSILAIREMQFKTILKFHFIE
jgi:hypothetical protein